MANAEALRFTAVPSRPYIALAAGTLIGSVGVIFIRNAQLLGVPSLVIVAIRLALVTAFLTPLVINRNWREVLKLSRKDWLLSAFAGINFAIQVITGFESITHTSVLIAGVIGGSVPLWVALMEKIFLKATISRFVWNGLFLALGGAIIISLAAMGGTKAMGDNVLLGSALSLISAFLAASYFITGRSVRSHTSFLTYTWLVCGFAAATSLLIAFVTHTPLVGYSTEAYFWIILVTLGPQLIVQSSYTYALAYLSPTFISLTSQIVTVGNAIAAFIVYNQIPLPLQILGSGIIFAGVLLAIIGQTRSD